MKEPKSLGRQLDEGDDGDGQDGQGHQHLEQCEAPGHDPLRSVLTRPVSGWTVMTYARDPGRAIAKRAPVDMPCGRKVTRGGGVSASMRDTHRDWRKRIPSGGAVKREPKSWTRS